MSPGNPASAGLTLCIEDPLDAGNDVGRGSFLFYRVKSAFEDAYVTLARLVRPGAPNQMKDISSVDDDNGNNENSNADSSNR